MRAAVGGGGRVGWGWGWSCPHRPSTKSLLPSSHRHPSLARPSCPLRSLAQVEKRRLAERRHGLALEHAAAVAEEAMLDEHHEHHATTLAVLDTFNDTKVTPLTTLDQIDAAACFAARVHHKERGDGVILRVEKQSLVVYWKVSTGRSRATTAPPAAAQTEWRAVRVQRQSQRWATTGPRSPPSCSIARRRSPVRDALPRHLPPPARWSAVSSGSPGSPWRSSTSTSSECRRTCGSPWRGCCGTKRRLQSKKPGEARSVLASPCAVRAVCLRLYARNDSKEKNARGVD